MTRNTQSLKSTTRLCPLFVNDFPSNRSCQLHWRRYSPSNSQFDGPSLTGEAVHFHIDSPKSEPLKQNGTEAEGASLLVHVRDSPVTNNEANITVPSSSLLSGAANDQSNFLLGANTLSNALPQIIDNSNHTTHCYVERKQRNVPREHLKTASDPLSNV